MMDTVYIYLKNLLAEQIAYCHITTQVTYGHGTLKEFAEIFNKQKIIVIIPGSHVLLMSANLPQATRSKKIQALPFLLEEFILNNVEENHFAVLNDITQETLQIAVITRTYLNSILTLFSSYQLHIQMLVPDILSIPHIAQNWSLKFTSNTVLLRINENRGIACDKTNWQDLFKLLLSEHATSLPNQLHIFEEQTSIEKEFYSQFMGEVVFHPEKSDIIPLFVENLTQQPPTNLLQNEFAPKTLTTHARKFWQVAAITGLIWLITTVSSQMLALHYLKQHHASLDKQIRTLYMQEFPQATSVIDPRIRLQRKLDQIGSNQGKDNFIELLELAGSTLHNTDIQILDMSFNNNILQLTIKAQDFQSLETLTNQLHTKGLQAKQQNVSSQDEKVRAQLIISKGN